MTGNNYIFRVIKKATVMEIVLLATLTSAANVLIEDFSSDPELTWFSRNDSVMGGLSTGTVTVEDGVCKLKGEVVNVPSLSAPGFITMETQGGDYPDVSTCKGIGFMARSNSNYSGYRFSFGSAQAPGSRYTRGFHAPFQVGNDFVSVKIPFTDFSDNWDGKTGDIKVACVNDPSYCPQESTLRNLGTMQFLGEGILGMVDLDIKSVNAYDCSDLERGVHAIAIEISVVACFVSFASLFFVLQMKMNETGPVLTPVLTVDNTAQVY